MNRLNQQYGVTTCVDNYIITTQINHYNSCSVKTFGHFSIACISPKWVNKLYILKVWQLDFYVHLVQKVF